MIGNNKIHLNQATMREAVQEYLDARSLPRGKVKVVSIKHSDSVFIIEVTTPETDSASQSES